MKNGKFTIYQVLPRIAGNTVVSNTPGGSVEENGSGKFADITPAVLHEWKRRDIDYVWYTGIIRHAVTGDVGVKGGAGSPFAITDYYDVCPYLSCSESHEGRMAEFEALVARTKGEGLGVIMDFVPNHVSPSYKSAVNSFSDENFYPGRIHDGDWTDTVKLNYCSSDTWDKMRDILLFWAGKGISGFRCDMVELVPVEFWAWVIPEVKQRYPQIMFIGEAYQPSNYPAYLDRGGFDYLYDKSGFYDTLRKIVRGEAPACSLTSEWQKLGKYQPKMLNFLENHDEDRIVSPNFASDPFHAISALFVSLFFNTAPFMLYFGQEIGEGPEKTSIFDFCSLPKFRRLMKGINEGENKKYLDHEEKALYDIYKGFLKKAKETPAICEGSTFDLEYANLSNPDFDPNKQFAFIRYDSESRYLCVANFADYPVDVRVNIPEHAFECMGIPMTPELNSTNPVRISIERNAGAMIELQIYPYFCNDTHK